MIGDLEMDCSICIRTPSVRIAWGCDKPTSNPFINIECPRCWSLDLECEKCKGTGLIGIDRCPYKSISPEIFRLASYYSDWKEGRLPVAGGICDQSARYVQAMKLMDKVIAKSRKEE